jgi:hypothetical protein
VCRAETASEGEDWRTSNASRSRAFRAKEEQHWRAERRTHVTGPSTGNDAPWGEVSRQAEDLGTILTKLYRGPPHSRGKPGRPAIRRLSIRTRRKAASP